MLNGSSWDETDAGLQLIKVRLHHIQRTAIRGKRLKNLPRILLDLGRPQALGTAAPSVARRPCGTRKGGQPSRCARNWANRKG